MPEEQKTSSSRRDPRRLRNADQPVHIYLVMRGREKPDGRRRWSQTEAPETSATAAAHGGELPLSAKLLVTGASLVVTSASLVVTSASLVVTSASLLVTSASLVVTSASLLVTSASLVVTSASLVVTSYEFKF